MLTFQYSSKNFLWPENYKVDEESLSEFDELLRRKWDDARENEYFRYKLDKLEAKIIPGKLRLIAQLNELRAQERRKPQDIQKISQPFCKENFNFTKIKKEEILFELANSTFHSEEKEDGKNLLIINVSPLEYCNSLLVPLVNNELPQLLTKQGLQLAIELVLLSGTRNLKVGFNSLCAYASVNHHHFHAYYLNERLPVENVTVEHLSGSCYVIGGQWPAEGFAFELRNQNVSDLVGNIFKLSEFLVQEDISHNVMITRGSSFKSPSDGNCSSLRVYVWARISSYGIKDDFALNTACCELAGHLPLKTEESYKNIDEEKVSKILYDACHDVYFRVKPHVAELFS